MPIWISFLARVDGFDQGKKIAGWRILRDKIIRLALSGRLPIFREVITCQDDDGDVRIAHFDPFGKVNPALSRQTDIHKNDIGMKGINLRKEYAPIRFYFYGHRWKPANQNLLEHLSKDAIIFNN